MQDSAQQIFTRYLRDRPKADIAIGISQGTEHKYAFLSGAKSPYAGIDKHSIFEVGSVSKTFTSVLLEKAVLAGYTEPFPAGGEHPQLVGGLEEPSDDGCGVDDVLMMPVGSSWPAPP